MGFSRAELESCRGRSVPDLLADDVKLLFVGINPGLWTVATQTHFCHPSNRFYPALRAAGIIDWDIDHQVGMSDWQRDAFTGLGLGITNLVNRATARASELEKSELRAGADRLVRLVEVIEPEVVAVAGVSAFRDAFAEPGAAPGRQPGDLADAELWAVPNPSGLNAHETVASLAGWYLQVARAAGVV